MPSPKRRTEPETSKVKTSLVVIKWIQNNCRVPEGKDVGKEVKLRDWQKHEIEKIYDNLAGTRRAIISFGRKNAKTTMAAFLTLVHLAGPMARTNAQLYSAAQSRDQAAILYALAAKVVRMSPELSAIIKVVASTGRRPAYLLLFSRMAALAMARILIGTW